MSSHPENAQRFLADGARARWHDGAVWFLRAKRDRASALVPDWEALRERAAAIKAHSMARLADYLEEFERNASRLGAHVHWARDAEEHNRIVHELLSARGVRRVAKSKSMLTEECHLNPYLEARGIEVVDTDLGERIVQLAGEPPSHIVVPAIHRKKEEIGDLFHTHLHTLPGASDPKYLTEAARNHLRERFMNAQAGISGVNFAVAETGGIVVCTNEGNADMGTSLPPLHIACMGFDKLIPRASDLSVFLRLLARSGTGQAITTFSSHFHGPLPGGELHIVIVDNGRSGILAKERFRRSLSCIRCGACMNTCPVYRRSGGYSYDNVIPGPIGAVLAPHGNPEAHASLPFASSLCGSCTDVCPVKVDLHAQLLAWREELAQRGYLPWTKRTAMALTAWLFARPRLYALAGRVARSLGRVLPRAIVYGPWNPWGRMRELPALPRQSFRELWRNLDDQR